MSEEKQGFYTKPTMDKQDGECPNCAYKPSTMESPEDCPSCAYKPTDGKKD